MKLRWIQIMFLAFSLGAGTLPAGAQEEGAEEKATDEFRSWRTVVGAPFEAKLVLDQGQKVILETKDGKKVMVVVSQLSHKDQTFLRDWRQQKSQKSLTEARTKVGLAPLPVPQKTRVVGPGVEYLSAQELGVIEEMNLARTDPAGYAKFLGSAPTRRGDEPRTAREEAIEFLLKAQPRKPLAPSKPLAQAARDHVRDAGPKGIVGHTGSDKSSPFDRIARYAQLRGSGENIAYGYNTPREIVIAWIVDEGVPGRGHRENIFNPAYSQAGVSIGSHSDYRIMCVVTFGM